MPGCNEIGRRTIGSRQSRREQRPVPAVWRTRIVAGPFATVKGANATTAAVTIAAKDDNTRIQLIHDRLPGDPIDGSSWSGALVRESSIVRVCHTFPIPQGSGRGHAIGAAYPVFGGTLASMPLGGATH